MRMPRLASNKVIYEVSVKTSFFKTRSFRKDYFPYRNKIAGVLPEMKITLLNTTAESYDTSL